MNWTYQHFRKGGHRFECLFVKERILVAVFWKEFLYLLAVSNCGRLRGHHEDQGVLTSALLIGNSIPTPLPMGLRDQSSRLACMFEILIRIGGRKACGKRRNQSQQPKKNEYRESMGRRQLCHWCGSHGALEIIQKREWIRGSLDPQEMSLDPQSSRYRLIASVWD